MIDQFAYLGQTLLAVKDLAGAMVGLRDAALINSKVIDLQQAIMAAQSGALSAQQEHFMLSMRVKALEDECVRLKDWSAEKEGYALAEVAAGVFVYLPKERMGTIQATHKLCCHCFEAGHKSLLQQARNAQLVFTLSCHECRAVLEFRRYLDGSSIQI